MRTVSTHDVCRMTGASYRQLDYWCRMGLIEGQQECVGSGGRRRWTPAQIARATALRDASELKATPLSELADRLSGTYRLSA